MQKYLVPIKPSNLVSRKCLINKITNKLESNTKSVFIKAPGGYGKTYLMTEFAHLFEKSDKAVVWLSCNADDNSFDYFAVYFLNELRSQKLIDDTLVYDENISFVRFSHRLFEQLEASERDICFFFDDLHLINEPCVIDFISELCLQSPRNIQVIVASRIEPPFATAKGVISEKIININQQDLSFSSDEIKHISELSSLNTLTDHETELVVNRTDGWPAIVGPSIYSDDWHVKSRNWIKEFSNTNTTLAEYFYQDILSALSEQEQQDLISLSITEYLSDDLIKALIGRENFSKRIINVIPITQFNDPSLPDHKQSFSIHPLMRECLNKQLKESPQINSFKLHQNAAHWMLKQNLHVEAAEQFIKAELFEAAVNIIEDRGLEIIASGNFPGFKKLIKKIPMSVLNTNPFILVLLGWIYALNYQNQNAHNVVLSMKKIVEDNPELAASYHSPLIAISGAMGLFNDTVFVHEEIFKAEMAKSPLPLSYAENSIRAEYCLLAMHNNDFELVNSLINDSEFFARGGQLFYSTVVIRVSQTVMELSFGNLDKALQVCDYLDDFIANQDGHYLVDNIITVLRGIIAYYQGNLQSSKAAFSKSGAIVSYLSEPSFLSWYYAAHLQLLTDLGEQEQKEILIEQFRELVKPRQLTLSKVPLVYEVIEHYFSYGNRDDALNLYQNFKQDMIKNQHQTGHTIVNEALVDSLVLTDAGEYEQAKQIITEQCKYYEDAGRVLPQLKCLLSLVNLNVLSENTAAAKANLKKAIAIAASKQLLQPFARINSIAIGYLQDWSNNELSVIRKAFIIKVCESFEGQGVEQSFDANSFEQLTKKEQSVMELLGQGFSNQQIADELFLSINTVKSHLKVAYKKLGVSNRIQATKLFTRINFNG